MAYLRPPNTIRAGLALKQTPAPGTLAPAGILPVTFDANVATTASLGVVQVGSNITVNPSGVIDVTFPDSGVTTINVTQTTGPIYPVTLSDNYIGVYSSTPVTINLPAGVNGREYTIKDEFGLGSGLITIVPNGVETIDTDINAVISIPLGSITIVFRAGGFVPGWHII
jgi:hypothetical protein